VKKIENASYLLRQQNIQYKNRFQNQNSNISKMEVEIGGLQGDVSFLKGRNFELERINTLLINSQKKSNLQKTVEIVPKAAVKGKIFKSPMPKQRVKRPIVRKPVQRNVERQGTPFHASRMPNARVVKRTPAGLTRTKKLKGILRIAMQNTKTGGRNAKENRNSLFLRPQSSSGRRKVRKRKWKKKKRISPFAKGTHSGLNGGK